MAEGRARARPWTMVLLAAAAAAWPAGPSALSAQETRPYSIDELVDLIEAGVPGTLIAERARANCIAVPIGEDESAALLQVGADLVLVEALQAVCVRLPGAVASDSADVTPPPGDEADLDPVLARAVVGRLVQISYLQGGRLVCTNGYVAGSDGLVLTTLTSLPTSGRFQVADGEGRRVLGEVSVALRDEDRGVAVLRSDGGGPAPLPPSAGISAGDDVWAVHAPGCGAPRSDRSRIVDWPGALRAPAFLDGPWPASVSGAPVVDGRGALVGLATGPTALLPASLTEDLLDRARTLVAQETSSDGGFPWGWVGAGAVAAVAGAVLAARGGQNAPDPGTISVPLP